MSSEVIIGAGPTRRPMSAADRGAGELVRPAPTSRGRGAAEVVEERHMRAVGHQRARAGRDHGSIAVPGVGEVDLLDPGLAVDAEPELGLAGRDPLAPSASPEWCRCRATCRSSRCPRSIRRAAAATVSRSAPSSASAPAILCTKSVPAMPRGLRQVRQRHVVVDDHHVTLRPKARARSAARPKFSRSPV